MRTRFAPSPTGHLHLGHAYSAITAWRLAKKFAGEFVLRIEDIDTARAKPAFEQSIFDDLQWLGITWSEPVLRQSTRLPAYGDVLNLLISKGLCYPCACSRADIHSAISAPQENAQPVVGPNGVIYPGTCRHRDMRYAGPKDAIRLNMQDAIVYLGGPAAVSRLNYRETGGDHPGSRALDAQMLQNTCGDIVLARRDIGTSYHVAVVVDDAHQAISHVVRGRDLLPATPIHRLLQALLDLPVPSYHHHRLIRDHNGKRLAKRDGARAIQQLRTQGFTARAVLAMIDSSH